MSPQANRAVVRHLARLLLAGLLAGCVASPSAISQPSAAVLAAQAHVQLMETPLAAAGPCTGTFVARDLDHITSAGQAVPRLFDSNGSGLAVGDLDGDGDPDIVLANLSGPATILWNQGGLSFEKQALPMVHRTRATALVDVDADGLLDIAFTSGIAAPAVFRNLGDHTFGFLPLAGVTAPAYAMNWSDLDQDGDLDLVTGSYDAGQSVELGPNYLFAAAAGVNVYIQENGGWRRQQLADKAQALAIGLWDLNDDGHPDIWVGNDFDEYDRVWLQSGSSGWEAAEPFAHTTHSTMGIDRGDVDNNGSPEYYATDMKPFALDTVTLAKWIPLMDAASKKRTRDDPQVMENVLQVKHGDLYQNEGYERRVDAEGWSWSGKFGDLDVDGDLDLYVVNGMIAADLLDHLPGGELVEANRALRNDGGQFTEVPAWGLASTRSGRGMSMADFDGDGDLDIVVNNLDQPAQLFENQLCNQGDRLALDLRWPHSHDPFALGATVLLHTDKGDLMRDVRAVSGYLSGDPTQLQFGLAPGAMATGLSVVWPDGAVSEVDNLVVNQHIVVTRMD
ncbi:MAG: CRTAC1 family protein [Caldilineaceae bacterium]